MATATIYTTRFCGFCFRAKQLLDSKGVEYTEIAVDGDHQARQQLSERTGQRTVPQIWVDDLYVGGCTELYHLERSGELDKLLSSNA